MGMSGSDGGTTCGSGSKRRGILSTIIFASMSGAS